MTYAIAQKHIKRRKLTIIVKIFSIDNNKNKCLGRSSFNSCLGHFWKVCENAAKLATKTTISDAILCSSGHVTWKTQWGQNLYVSSLNFKAVIFIIFSRYLKSKFDFSSTKPYASMIAYLRKSMVLLKYVKDWCKDKQTWQFLHRKGYKLDKCFILKVNKLEIFCIVIRFYGLVWENSNLIQWTPRS